MILRFSPALAMALAAAALLPLAAPAQTPAPAPAPAAAQDEAGVHFRGLSFQVDDPLSEVYAHDPLAAKPGLGTKVDVKNYLNHEFNQLPLSGDSVVFTTKPDPASVKDPAEILGKAKFAANLKSAIFMFLPGSGKAGEPRCRVLVIDDKLRAFPRGSLKILNLSPLPVRIQLEKETYDFKSGETRLIENPPVAENNLSGMRAFCQRGNEWQRIASGMWPHPGEKRVLQVLFENPASKQIEMKGIRDISIRDD